MSICSFFNDACLYAIIKIPIERLIVESYLVDEYLLIRRKGEHVSHMNAIHFCTTDLYSFNECNLSIMPLREDHV